jgi:tripartite-type tricarboxylate transporter receptor subunit TctC
MKTAFVAAIPVALACAATTAGAQDYPSRPIHFIATEVVGSATDIQARIIAKGITPSIVARSTKAVLLIFRLRQGRRTD